MAQGGSDLRSTIARELATGKSEDEVVELLRSRGLSESTARRFVAQATGGGSPASPSAGAPARRTGGPTSRPSPVAPSQDEEPDGTWRMTVGVFFLFLGLAITGLTFLLARPGGKFLLAWGAVAYGLVDLGRGAARWWPLRDRVSFPLGRVGVAAALPIAGAGALLVFSPRGRAVLGQTEEDRTREEIREAIREYRDARFPGRTPEPERPPLGSTVPALIEGLSSPDAFTRRTAAQRLSLMEQEAAAALPALTNALGDSDPRVRSSILYALGNIDPTGDRSAPFVSARLNDPDAEVRVEAGRALSRMGKPSGVEALVRELRTGDTRARELAASALETVDTARAVAALIHCVESDPSARARASCVLALRRAGPESVAALPALVKAAKDADPQVQKRAVMVHQEVTQIAEAQARAASRR